MEEQRPLLMDHDESITHRNHEHLTNDSVTINIISNEVANKKANVILFIVVNVITGLFYSMLGPFFVQEASKKGVSIFMSGIIFGIFEIIVIISCPIFGLYMTKIGVKRQFLIGIFISGICVAVFGVLDYIEDSLMFTVSCLVVRSVEALGFTAEFTASYSMIVSMYPDRAVSLIVSAITNPSDQPPNYTAALLEAFSGIGMMIGPAYGGFLYYYGGYATPFITSGALLLVIWVAAIFIVKDISDSSDSSSSGVSFFKFLIIPEVLVAGLMVLFQTGILGFIDVALATYLEKEYKLSTIKIGLIFIITTSSYAISTPIWGRISELKKSLNRGLIIFGTILSAIAVFMIGPTEFLPFKSKPLWVINIAQFVIGIGAGSIALSLQEFINVTKKLGMEENLESYGMISSMMFMFCSAGFFIGPIYGGFMMNNYGFEKTSQSIGIFGFVIVILMSIFFIYKKIRNNRNGIYVEQQTYGTS